jgi:hypothetical protein
MQGVEASQRGTDVDVSERPAKPCRLWTQLTICAMALSRRTGLPVKAFTCAWFDEQDDVEFFPLPPVYPKPVQRLSMSLREA